MTTVKEICLGVAVAGVVAGAGSAAATGVAYAETPGSDTHNTADSGHSDPPRSPRAAVRKALRDVADRVEAAADDARTDRAAVKSRLKRPASVTDAKDRGSKGTRTTSQKSSQPTGLPAAASISGSVSPRSSIIFRRESAPIAGRDAIAQQFVATRQSIESAVRSAEAGAERAVQAVRNVLVLSSRTPVRAPFRLPLPAPFVPNATIVSAYASSTTRVRTATTADVTAQAVDPSKQHVLVIGVDGTNLGRVLNPVDGVHDNVNFAALMAAGTTSASTIVGHTTLSNPSWTTILTGVWDTKSGVFNNIFTPQTYAKWPTVFNKLEAAYGDDVDTKTIADWDIIADISEAGGDLGADETVLVDQVPGDTNWSLTDAKVTDKTVEAINGTLPDYADPNIPNFLFTYLVQVDENGHQYGGDSQEYADAVTRTDTNLGEIMAAVKAREDATGEQWTVIVVTDHGHQPQFGFGHGFQSPDETSTFVIARGPGYDPGRMNLSYSIVDVTPTVVNIFGIPESPDYDGVPLGDKAQSNVLPANLSQALTDAIALNNYPDIITNVVLGFRTIVGAIPYYLDGFTTDITEALQGIVDQDIFLVSGLAEVAKVTVHVVGNTLVVVTQGVAEVVGHLTGVGNIAPTAPPLVPALQPTTAPSVGVLV